MKMRQSPPDESYTIRCPRLGHQIPFSYCRSENRGLPCFKCLDCWYEHFLIEDWLRNALTPEEWQKAFERPTGGKMLSLVELIQEAKKKQEEGP
ncbi:MAG: hypothetical protein ACOWYE_04625 [Desulfatiglandales bacterium]